MLLKSEGRTISNKKILLLLGERERDRIILTTLSVAGTTQPAYLWITVPCSVTCLRTIVTFVIVLSCLWAVTLYYCVTYLWSTAPYVIVLLVFRLLYCILLY